MICGKVVELPSGARHGGVGNHFKGGRTVAQNICQQRICVTKEETINSKNKTDESNDQTQIKRYEGAARSIGISKGKRKNKRS
jgi:hypothetical protein